DRGPALDLVEGEAHQVRGDWDSAVDRLSRLVPDDGSVPVAVAWRLGLIHHQRGDLPTALRLYRRGLNDPAPGGHPGPGAGRGVGRRRLPVRRDRGVSPPDGSGDTAGRGLP